MAKPNPKKKNDTSWGDEAKWYNEYLEKEDTYQAKVILPNLIRLLNIKKDDRVLDLACGQGFFARELVKCGANIVGSDISSELIKEARKNVPEGAFHVASASKLTFAKNAEFDLIVCVLALQNMDDIATVFAEVKRVLKPRGRFVFVINHPTFRVLKRSSWGWDEKTNIQYRRIDGYLSGAKISVDMHPGSGSENAKKTISYHRSLQDFFKALSKVNLVVTKLEEWISHKTSEHGPRQKAEDTARKEIPLFMALEARSR